MNNQIVDLKEIEKKTFLAYHQDGLLDLVGGIMLLIAGILMQADMMHFVVAVWLVSFTYLPAKQKFTYPRIGYAGYSPSQKSRLRTYSIISVAAGLTMLGLVSGQFLSAESLDIFRKYSTLVTGIVLGGVIALAGYLFNTYRYIFYGLVLIVVFALANSNVANLPAYLMGLGIFISIAGLATLLRFVRKFEIVNINE